MHRFIILLAAALCTAGPAQAETVTADAVAADIRFYYEDVPRAAQFYRENLGLHPVKATEESVVLEVAPGAFLTLATLESGGYTPDTPRTAAIALVTDQLDEWWEALTQRGLDMRTESYNPVPGRAHHGFVLADPEGWLLEFERFNPHPENTALMPQLNALQTRYVDGDAAGLPEQLGFKATVLWLYYEDLAAAENFLIESLGLPLITDQGWAKIHAAAPTTFLGLVDGARGMHTFTPEKAVTFELLTSTLAAQKSQLAAKDIPIIPSEDGSFEVLDPGDHRLRWRSVASRD
ncbi:VOC family protein [Congregibacter brevis]|uniref:VOC family protein n=1 Tax=Congregibacter brevis TaxID=3081201 RepID=A0ABZ0IKE4_9GAMM|nr:VOC family protein [Congregibacter sp. IMCC45268]